MKNTVAVNNPKKPRKRADRLLTERFMLAQKALASVAIEDNRLAERLLADVAAGKGEKVQAFLDSHESAKKCPCKSPSKCPRSVLQNVPVNEKLHQVGAEIVEKKKLQQVVGEFKTPEKFAMVPWRHHTEIISKCKSIDKALF